MARAANKSVSPIDSPSRRRLPPLLRTAWYSLNQAFRRRIHRLHITPDQFTVLRWLQESGEEGVTQRKLGDLMASDPNTVTSVLGRMEESGLVERRTHESDRRAKRVRLKPLGRKAFDEARQIAVDLQSQVLRVLPADQREGFLQQLELIADSAHKASTGSPEV